MNEDNSNNNSDQSNNSNSNNDKVFSLQVQYLKDFSFESPDAPYSLGESKSSPKVDLDLDIKINRLEENRYEVALIISVVVSNERGKLFILELVYAGLFQAINLEEDELRYVLSVNAPSLLFPYARKIISSATQDGGFQPLMMDPIDFTVLYHKKLQEENNSKKENNNS